MTMQRNWIDRSQGQEIVFRIKDSDRSVTCFTTRPDTLFGATFLVVSPEHPVVLELIQGTGREADIRSFMHENKVQQLSGRARTEPSKAGLFIERYAINPINDEVIPIFIAPYVLMEYGTGAIMAVPAHDQRDFEFARENGLAIREVIRPDGGGSPLPGAAYEGKGTMVNSGRFDGLSSEEGYVKIAEYLEARSLGRRRIHYRLRDWLISRQRYWGAPIPMIHCPNCGIVPVPEKALPVVLPEVVEFHPTGDGKSPLATNPDFVEVSCPDCGEKARRDTDTMDTFVDSSWYFLRYLSPHDHGQPFDKSMADRWLPVDQYIGGVEHAILHLLYSRFIIKFLQRQGYISFSEPFQRLFTQGMITKDGFKMSKSKGNVVSPSSIIQAMGADTMRLYILFSGPPERDAEWKDDSVEGCYRFLNRIYRLFEKHRPILESGQNSPNFGLKNGFQPEAMTDPERKLFGKIHWAIQRVINDINDNFHFNTAISGIMELSNEMHAFSNVLVRDTGNQSIAVMRFAFDSLIRLLAPMTPHLCEELWECMGNRESVFRKKLPYFDPEYAKGDTVTLVIQINSKIRAREEIPIGTPEKEIRQTAMNNQRIRELLGDRKPKKIIVIKNKMVNIVV
jgi:leucyl-tRNA synthetase